MSLCRQTRNSCTALDDEAYNYLPTPPLTQHLIYVWQTLMNTGKLKIRLTLYLIALSYHQKIQCSA